MPPLVNIKREKFCLEYFRTGNSAASAVVAGYSVKAVRQVSSRLLTYANVKMRIAELQAKAESEKVMSVRERKERLSEIGRARVSDFIRCKGGKHQITVEMDSANSAALQEVTSEEIKMGRGKESPVARITKLKLRDPVSAIAELNKMEKVYDDSPKVNILNVYDLSSLSEKELDALEQIVRKASPPPLIGTNPG